MSDGVGTLCTATHWLRGIKAHGGPPRALFFVQIWWPLSDPSPGMAGR